MKIYFFCSVSGASGFLVVRAAAAVRTSLLANIVEITVK